MCQRIALKQRFPVISSIHVLHTCTYACTHKCIMHIELCILLLVNLKLHNKDDDILKAEALSGSKELERSLQTRDLRIATLESKLRAKEAQLIAAMNPKKKRCGDAAIQADYLAVTECKEVLILYCKNLF